MEELLYTMTNGVARVLNSQLVSDKASPEIVFASAAMAKLLSEADRVKQKDFPVLIQGETGTGKEALAKRLHAGRGPFVIIDCTQLSANLTESELFGHTKGAYTGAHLERSGLIEAANGGVAFFDEVGELSQEVQAKLLRLLQQGTYRRVGSTLERRSQFRVVAATNRDLKKESKLGRFRDDLYHRINVIKLSIPPLRDRKEDIPPLVDHFLKGTGLEMPPAILEQLLRYDWPGNVRELENCIRRMVAHSDGDRLRPEQLPATVCTGVAGQALSLVKQDYGKAGLHDGARTRFGAVMHDEYSLCTACGVTSIPAMSLQTLEYYAILQALQETNGDRTRAAGRLGIGRTTLYRKIKDMEHDSRFSHIVGQFRGIVDGR